MDRTTLTILVTGVGCPGFVGTVTCLYKNWDRRRIRLVGVDCRSGVIGECYVDRFYQVPYADDKDYIDTIRDIVEKEKVGVVLPLTSPELFPLSKHDVGCPVCVSGEEAITIANDKVNILLQAEALNLDCAVRFNQAITWVALQEALVDFGYPKFDVVIRPKWSSGSRGFRIISEKKLTVGDFFTKKPGECGKRITFGQLADVFEGKEFPKLIINDYFEGDEYSVDCFRNNDFFLAIPRKRNEIRSGISFNTVVELRKDLIDYCHKLSDAMDLRYAFGFQFKMDKDGNPKLLECNPRVMGSMIASYYAGYNIIYAGIKEAMGEKVRQPREIKDGTQTLRYWGSRWKMNG